MTFNAWQLPGVANKYSVEESIMSDKPSPYSYRVKSIKKIIDGDTFDCIMDLGFDVLLEARVRMMGIDLSLIHI